MLGVFQGEILRVELEVAMETIQSYLVEPEHLRNWVWPQTLDPALSAPLQTGTEFFSQLGSIPFGHRVESLQPGLMHLLLWGARMGSVSGVGAMVGCNCGLRPSPYCP